MIDRSIGTLRRKRRMLLQAMHDPEELVVRFTYIDFHKKKTTRVVSPIQFVSRTDFVALCLTREEPRRFNSERCRDMWLDYAREYVMPWKPE